MTLYSEVFLFLPLLYPPNLTDLSCACNGGLQVQGLSFEAVNYLVITWYLFSIHGGPPSPSKISAISLFSIPRIPFNLRTMFPWCRDQILMPAETGLLIKCMKWARCRNKESDTSLSVRGDGGGSSGDRGELENACSKQPLLSFRLV